MASSWPSTFGAVEQIRIHATQIGDDGARIVFLHGLFGQGKNFTRIAKSLTPQFTSLLVDLPNHGRSDWTEQVDYVDLADRVGQFLRDGFAADGPVHVVGHSMGGKVAMVLALRHPDLVDRLVVADIAPRHSESAGQFEHLLDSLKSLDLSRIRRRGEADEQLKPMVPDDTVRGFLLQNLRSTPDGFRWQANLELLRDSLIPIAGFPHIDATFDHPVLWLAGERSDYITDQDRPEMERLFPRMTYVVIKNAGHWLHSEQPEAFTSALRVFLSTDRWN
ncbi:alpha/beta fold hydrolase [Branchiibius cervicis]|uniref:Alpha/beta fold hydrolase n=1 Tax=Branchiibius cervicis TaxID=908252 RepID=A0ABW2ARN2_9MICO